MFAQGWSAASGSLNVLRIGRKIWVLEPRMGMLLFAIELRTIRFPSAPRLSPRSLERSVLSWIWFFVPVAWMPLENTTLKLFRQVLPSTRHSEVTKMPSPPLSWEVQSLTVLPDPTLIPVRLLASALQPVTCTELPAKIPRLALFAARLPRTIRPSPALMPRPVLPWATQSVTRTLEVAAIPCP